ncbi:MAG: class I fructose-bisphosphate aldolase [Desulfovibrionaceae bacterium]
MIGSLRKLQRFFDPDTRRALILALDHGAGEGMLPGLAAIPDLIEAVNRLNVQGVVLQKGLARAYASQVDPDVMLTVQLSAGTRHGVPGYNKSLVCSVPEALRLGADAVSVLINIGNDLEDRMLQDCGMVTDEAHQLGLPVVAVIQAQGGQIVNERDPILVAHCIRLGGELGADLVCTPYSGEPQSFSQAVLHCPAPVIVTGGPAQQDFDTFLKTMHEVLELGASGVSVGRNILMQPKPVAALEALVALVHGPEMDEPGANGPGGAATPAPGAAKA